ncbi:MAG TPA: autotransporter-associated beta strand repeat-containing protein [Kiritimatiellia bacterium]|nr:autotransporter-associated beta strand repeat-containing protein [Kiritimatiellia bacterium]
MRTSVIGTVMVVCAICVQGATKFWTGEGADDKFSTDGNWEGMAAPVNGDTLVFQGENAVAENDFDSTVQFAAIYMSNSVPFTIRGNTLYLSGNRIFAKSLQSEITDRFEADVVFSGGASLGAASVKQHHITFLGTVASASGGTLSTDSQTGNIFTFEGMVTNFSHVYRPNGNGTLRFFAPTNHFTNPSSFQINQGTITVSNLTAFGTDTRTFSGGQGRYNTPAIIQMYPTADETAPIHFKVYSPNQQQSNLQLYNNTPGVTLTFTGDVSLGWTVGNGGRIAVGGAGDGMITGDFTSPNLALYKSDTGIWELAGAYASTGVVTVAAGTLVVNTVLPTNTLCSVTAGLLCGTGTLHRAILSSTSQITGGVPGMPGTLHFANGGEVALTVASGTLVARPKADGTPSLVAVDGTVALTGLLTVNLDGDFSALPAGTYPLLTWTEKTGTGTYAAGSGFPSGSSLVETAAGLALYVPGAVLSWTGAVNGDWDTATANWNSGQVFADGTDVVFGDDVVNGQTNVTLTTAAAPGSVTISSDVNGYTFSGAKMTGTMTLLKTGNASLTLENDNDYTGLTTINGGTFRLNGSLDGSPLLVQPGAELMQGTNASIRGDVNVNLLGQATLSGSNTFTGDLVFGSIAEGKATGTVCNVSAIGGDGGNLVVMHNARVMLDAEGVYPNRTLRFAARQSGAGTVPYLKQMSGKTATWPGGIAFDAPAYDYSFEISGTLNLGTDPDAVITDAGSASASTLMVRGTGRLNQYARAQLKGGFGKTDNVSWHVYASNNVLSQFNISVGSAFLHAPNALSTNCTIKLGQVYGNNKFNSLFDFGGFDLAIAGLAVDQGISIEGNTQVFTTSEPATITLLGPGDTILNRTGTELKGALAIRKRGAATTLFLGQPNSNTGDFRLEEGYTVASTNRAFGYSTNLFVGATGTLTVSASDALPPEDDVWLRVADGGTVVLSNDVAATIFGLEINGRPRGAGTYGGEGSGARIILPAVFSGTGTLSVRNGAGTILRLH